jgi:hypothetical protein
LFREVFMAKPRRSGFLFRFPERPIKAMMELEVILDFACSHCGNTVGVTLKCEGNGLASGRRAVAAVHVPCPYCGDGNCLYFEPNGTVRAVSPYTGSRQVPEPSLN